MMLIGHQLQTSYQYFLIYQQSDQCLQFGSVNGMYIECMKCEQISSKFVTGLQNPINTSVVRKPGRVTTMTCKLNKKSLKKITALGSMTYLNEKTTGCHLKNSHMALLRVLNTNVKGLKIAPNLEGEMKRTKKTLYIVISTLQILIWPF